MHNIHRFVEGAGLACLGAFAGYAAAHIGDLAMPAGLGALLGAVAAAIAAWAKQEQSQNS